MKSINNKPLKILLFCLVILFFITIFPTVITKNIKNIQLIKAWNSLKLTQITVNNNLQDGIPDGWQPQSWGGSTQIYKLVEEKGDYSVSVEHTNQQGVTALIQTIEVMPESELICIIHAKGISEGAIQFQFRDSEENWIQKGWLDIEPSETWQVHQLKVKVPSNKTQAQLRLRSKGVILFNQAYVGIITNGQLGSNLLQNPSFEQDGLDKDPLSWWQTHIISSVPLLPFANYTPQRISSANIIDMLTGQYQSIQQRAQQIGNQCVFYPDMTAWLLTYDDYFLQTGGAAAQEKLYQLAIKLAPNCPQAYGLLAKQHESYKAFNSATNLYHQAAKLSGQTAKAGEYYLEEGILHVRKTGNFKQAILALQLAEELSGWEDSAWDFGIAPLNLGIALEAEGQLVQAAIAYQRVINCSACWYHHKTAQTKLNLLKLQ